jgi:hypothetical protein
MANSISLVSMPQAPFDGQVFIDAYRIKWVYDSEIDCWTKRGTVPSLPEASEAQRGLLSAKLKTLIDSIPPAGGHFSLIADPKLSTIPFRHTTLLKTKVISSIKTDAGSTIKIIEGESEALQTDIYAGKAALFTSGLLSTKTLFITGNNETSLFIQGPDGIQAKKGDKFEIVDQTTLNKDGLIYGDIVITSDSLEITFVDGDGNEIDGDCNIIQCDTPNKPPGINIRLSDKFLNEFCVQIPGCRGGRGDRGPKGPQGADGTGDGPQGLQGEPGEDATATHVFTGVKIKDIADVFDTAVVGVELDAARGKLHVVKARVKTADNTKPADQVIATAISRDIQFTDDNFKYTILMPNGDPVGDPNATILHYPESFDPVSGAGDNKPNDFTVWNVKLNVIIDAIIAQYKNKLDEISKQYDNDIKPFIEEKDKEARLILANLADEVAKCEFQLPIEFCVGITPMKAKGGCDPEPGATDISSPETDILGSDFEEGRILKLPPMIISPRTLSSTLVPDEPPTGIPTDTINAPSGNYSQPALAGDTQGSFASAGNNQTAFGVHALRYNDGSTVLPAGTYMVKWTGGSGRVDNSAHSVGVTINYQDDSGEHSVAFTEPEEVEQYNWDAKAYENARQNLSLDKNSVSFTLTSPGSASASFELEGDNPQGTVNLEMVRAFKPDETDLGIPLSGVVVSGTVDTTGSSVGGGPVPCNQTVNCGDFNPTVQCPDCAPQIQATSISPSSVTVAVPTTVTIIGSGFVDTARVYFTGDSMASTEMPVISQTNTTLVVSVILPDPGSYDIEINMGDSVAYAPNGVVAEPP